MYCTVQVRVQYWVHCTVQSVSLFFDRLNFMGGGGGLTPQALITRRPWIRRKRNLKSKRNWSYSWRIQNIYNWKLGGQTENELWMEKISQIPKDAYFISLVMAASEEYTKYKASNSTESDMLPKDNGYSKWGQF